MRKTLLSVILCAATSVAMAGTAPDFASMKNVQQKKKAFFDYIYASVEKENKKILAERKQLLNEKPNSKVVKNLCKKYSKDCDNIDGAKVKTLLKRVDFITPSLALAQAANESAWGTSRFARKANNYYGQWCFSKGCGLVPSRRNEGSSHEVRKFSDAQGSVRSYLMNLNTHRAYEGVRNIRAKARAAGKMPTGMDLAKGLNKYSERGEEYVKEIQSMISYNKLPQKYDEKFFAAIK